MPEQNDALFPAGQLSALQQVLTVWRGMHPGTQDEAVVDSCVVVIEQLRQLQAFYEAVKHELELFHRLRIELHEKEYSPSESERLLADTLLDVLNAVDRAANDTDT